jgi:hypothetical protein
MDTEKRSQNHVDRANPCSTSEVESMDQAPKAQLRLNIKRRNNNALHGSRQSKQRLRSRHPPQHRTPHQHGQAIEWVKRGPSNSASDYEVEIRQVFEMEEFAPILSEEQIQYKIAKRAQLPNQTANK